MRVYWFYKNINGHELLFKKITNTKADNTNVTIILLHHGLGSIQQWKNFPELLYNKIGISLILYNRVGYNKKFSTALPHNFLYYEAFIILPEIIKTLNLTNYILLGHSDGATIALLHASQNPSSLSKIIAIAPHVFIEPQTITGLKMNIKNSKHIIELLKKYHSNNSEILFEKWHNFWLSHQNKNWNIFKELQNIKIPLLIIQGKNDEFGTTNQINHIKKYCLAKTLLLNNCKHFPHLEYSEKVIHNIFEFIKN
ncbi:MAG: alpha/beta hydrolase [Bacteroidales bacterium]|nr:alpha/beta hydrolase [Bacteroidales bacterium]